MGSNQRYGFYLIIKGEPKEELYDAVLEVAAFARTQMIKTCKFQQTIPP